LQRHQENQPQRVYTSLNRGLGVCSGAQWIWLTVRNRDHHRLACVSVHASIRPHGDLDGEQKKLLLIFRVWNLK
jgi:uncharacterized protein (DUF58 family)